MSIYHPEFDETLQSLPWIPLSPLSHSEQTQQLLLKYAPHPHRPGYVLLLTDLSAVYVESLLAPGIPSRLSEIKKFHEKTAKGKKGRGGRKDTGEDDDDDDEEDVIKQSERALQRLGEFMDRLGQGEADEDMEVELGDHDYHDKVLLISSNDFTWQFNLTEMKGRQPLEIITSQLISPLVHLIAQDHDLPSSDNAKTLKGSKSSKTNRYKNGDLNGHEGALEALTTILRDQHIRGLLVPDAGGAYKGDQPSKSPKPKPTSTKAPKKIELAAADVHDQGEGADDGDRAEEEDEAEEEEEYHSDGEEESSALPVNTRTSGCKSPAVKPASKTGTTPTPKKSQAAKGKKIVDEDEGDDSMNGKDSESASVSPPPTRSHRKPKRITSDENVEEDNQPSIASALSTNTPSENDDEGMADSSKTHKTGKRPRSEDPEVEAEGDADLAPPTQSSQKTKKERELEDEEEMERKLGEMRKKMAGGGGGRLGRRRMAR